jgi:O-antigen ligase
MKILNSQKLTLLLFIIPLSFIAGIAVTEFLVFFCTILFLIINKDKSLFLDKKIIFLFLFSAYILINAYFQISDNLRLGSIFYFRYVLFSLAIFYFCKLFDTFKNKKYFFLLISCLLIIITDSLFQFFYGFNTLGFKIIGDRVSSFFNDELILGSFLVRLMPIILWFMFFLKIDLKKNIIHIIAFFSLYFITIYLSGGRTSFFLLFLIILGLFIIIKDFRRILAYSIIIMIFFIFITSYFKIGKANTLNRIFVKTYSQITKIEVNTNKSDTKIKKKNKVFNIYSDDHEGHILLALNLFEKNKIFGIGPKGFRHYCRKVNYAPKIGTCSTHPHNILIQIVLELGLIGLAFYIIAAIFVLFNFFKSIIRHKFNYDYLAFYSITLGLIINVFPLVPGGNFFNNWISIILYYNIGLYLYSYKKCILK